MEHVEEKLPGLQTLIQGHFYNRPPECVAQQVQLKPCRSKMTKMGRTGKECVVWLILQSINFSRLKNKITFILTEI